MLLGEPAPPPDAAARRTSFRPAPSPLPPAPSDRADGDRALAARLVWTTVARLSLLVVLLGVVSVIYMGGHVTRFPASSRIVLVTIALAFAWAAAFAAWVRRGQKLSLLANVQTVVDQVTWTAFLYVSGGAASGATSFYALTAVFAAILTGVRGAAIAAASGILAYGSLCTALWFGVLDPPSDQIALGYPTQGPALVSPVLLNVLGIVVVALLAGYLADRLRITGGALAIARKRASEAEHLAGLGRLAAGLAHEIRNPLGSISGSIEMLRESPALSEEDRYLCDIIRREASRLNNLVSDMVDLSRRRAPIAAAVDVAALARDVVALARAESRGVSDVRVEYDGPTERTYARCDSAQMRQVLWNLVRNALQASPAGSTVRVRVEADGPFAELTVEDEGPGIPDGERGRVFDAFYTTRSHGTGIGLAVVKRIVDDHAAMGASLSVDSGPKGARFTVRLSKEVSGLRRSLWPPPRAASLEDATEPAPDGAGPGGAGRGHG
jgi:signal transduction histidine kinase